MIAVDLLCFAQTILLHDTGFAPGGAEDPALSAAAHRGRTPTPTPATGRSDRQRSRPGTPPRHRHTAADEIDNRVEDQTICRHESRGLLAACRRDVPLGTQRLVLVLQHATRLAEPPVPLASRPPAPRRSTVGRDRANRCVPDEADAQALDGLARVVPRPWYDGRSQIRGDPAKCHTPGWTHTGRPPGDRTSRSRAKRVIIMTHLAPSGGWFRSRPHTGWAASDQPAM